MSCVANHILNEDLSYLSRDALFASSFTTLHKKDGGIQPIAVGNVFKRMASKLAVQFVRTTVYEQLRLVQVVFGVAGVAEAAVHVAQEFINNAHPHNIMLKVDM